jgi:ribosomal-protein-serine acetyltransferase
VALYTGDTFSAGEVGIGPPDIEALAHTPKATDVAASFAHWSAAATERDDVYLFAVLWRGTPVGQVLLHDIDWQAGTALVAYHLFEPRYRGRGIGTAALSLLVRFVHERTALRELVSITSRDNLASQRIAQKCGFVAAGTPREDPIDGVVHRWERPK